MEMDLGVFLEPALVLFVRVEIVEDDVKLAILEGGNEAVHEAEELDTTAALGMRRDDLAGGDFERCEQGGGAVPLVVVALACQGATVRQLRIALRPPIDRLLACPGLVLQPTKAVIGKAPPPPADDARLNAHFRGNRTRAAAFSRQQYYPRPLHVALRRGRCPAARLKHLAYLRLEPNLSCFGNHPDLES